MRHYEKALEISTKGNAIVLKCEPEEYKINNYDPSVMLAGKQIWIYNMYCNVCGILYDEE